MTLAVNFTSTPKIGASHVGRPGMSRGLVLAAIVVSGAAGLLVTDGTISSQVVSQAGADLTRLMRFMAALKGLMALGAAFAVLWRLGAAVTAPRLSAYALACGAMAAGPGLIWSMVHVGLGALLLHGGLLATVLLLWRDPAVAMRLDAVLRRRRSPAFRQALLPTTGLVPGRKVAR